MRVSARGCFAYSLRRRLPVRCEFRQAKIQDLRLSLIDEENVRGLDIAVDDALGVGRFKTIRNLNANVQQFG